MKISSKFAIPALAALFLLAFWLGLAGIDFGNHWDEIKLIRSVRNTYRSGELLPGWYNYPSVSYNLTLLSSLPNAIQVIQRESGVKTLNPFFYLQRAGEFYRQINATLEPLNFAPQMRPIFLTITLLTGLWLYALTNDLLKSRAFSLLAVALLYGSWEFSYHARWAAPDGLLTSFGLLAVWLALAGARQKRFGGLALSASVAALAAGSKYYGGLFLLPAAIATLSLEPRLSWRTLIRLALLGLLFGAVFLISTPGAFLQTQAFFNDIRFEIRHYSTFHYGQTVQAGPQHWGLLTTYLALTAFSPFAPLAAGVFALTLYGGWSLLPRLKRLDLLIVFLTPLIYVIYLGLQKVLIVRNDLTLLPFLALLAAGGAQAIGRAPWLKAGWPRALALTALIGLLAANFGWQGYAVQTIRARRSLNLAACLQTVVENQPQTRFYLSPQARVLLPPHFAPNLAASPETADVFLYISSEIRHALVSNHFGIYQTPCGPYELSFNYYPDWEGDPRLTAIKMRDAWPEPLVHQK